MKLGDVVNQDAVRYGMPLEGLRVLTVEQMQALPWTTQLLARFGADVVKVEHPIIGDSGRGSTPGIRDPQGRLVGCTYLRNNLNKRSVGIDLKQPEGRELFLKLAPHFDVVAENYRAGAMDAMGLGYKDVKAVHPEVIYLSVSGFGNTVPSPYASWPAYATVAEAMSGIYEFKLPANERPKAAPVGALGDIGSACMATIGVLLAVRQKERTGEGQYVDIAMFDTMVAFSDIVPNFYSMGQSLLPEELPAIILDSFKAKDGFFVMQVGREHQFARLARIIGHQEWLEDPELSNRQGWVDHMADVIRPAIESWASTRSKVDVCHELGAAGIAAGPSFHQSDVVNDPHLAARDMLVEIPRDDGLPPVLVPGNPVRMSKVAQGPESRPPWLGEDTDDVLGDLLGLSDTDRKSLREAGVIG
jgi:formyl-CoA transferase